MPFHPNASASVHQRATDTPPSLLPSALPAETPPKAPSFNVDISTPTHDSYQDAQASTVDPSPTDFTPFFTLITNTTSPATHHPSVHYIFSDDPPDNCPITPAALHILDTSHTSSNTSATGPASPTPSSEWKTRYILLDLDHTATRIVSAHSMSPDWAVVSTEVGPAPTWDGEQGGGESKGLMLRIEGMEMSPQGLDGEGKADGEEKALEGLVDEYERRMRELMRAVRFSETPDRDNREEDAWK